jgi:mRNA degradation ribonuclease J1/J2
MAEDVVEEVMAEDVEEPRITVGDIKALVATGKKKKIKAAKKAFKEQFAKGHPQHKELKKLLKEVA